MFITDDCDAEKMHLNLLGYILLSCYAFFTICKVGGGGYGIVNIVLKMLTGSLWYENWFIQLTKHIL